MSSFKHNHLEVLLNVSHTLTRSLKLTDVLQTAIDGAIDVLSLDTGAIYLFEQEELFLGATSPPLPADFPDKYRRARLSDHPHIHQCLHSGKNLFIQDCQLEEFTSEERGVVEARGLKSVLYVPIVAEDDSIGVFILGTTAETMTFKTIDDRLCSTLAHQVALAITNARLYESVQHANIQLEKSHVRLTDAQNVAKIGSWEWDTKENSLWWSDEMYSIFGLSHEKDEPSHDRFMELVHPDDRGVLTEMIGKFLQPGGINSTDAEYRIVRPDGEELYIFATAYTNRNDDGLPQNVAGISQDVTERFRVQSALAKSSRLAAVGQMASGVAHEINNPLATISACLEVLQNRWSKMSENKELLEINNEYLSLMENEIKQISKIIVELLDFSRSRPLEKKKIMLCELIDSTINLMQVQSKFSKYTIGVSVEENLPEISADRDTIRQVLVILLTNAFESMPNGGKIEVACHYEPEIGRAAFSVSDEGVGISRENIDRLFEPFFTTKTDEMGTGLGLSIAYNIISKHDGDISVQSSPFKGSTFKVTLPLG